MSFGPNIKPDTDIDAFARLIYNDRDRFEEAFPEESKSISLTNTVVKEIYPADDTSIEVFKPKITRPTMSKFEFVRVCTAAAKYLYALPDLSAYIKTPEVNDLINPAELAFLLIINKKLNATLDRLGYEKVTMSELRINPIWINTIRNYFNKRHANEHREILIAYGLLKDNKSVVQQKK